MKDLLAAANDMGVVVSTTRLPDGLLGFYALDLSRIFIDARLTPFEMRVVLAHEIGHAHYGHACDRGATESIRSHEHRADRYAARLLIPPGELARLESVNDDRHYLADELRVTVDFIDWYRDHFLTKLTGITYAGAREGIGNWHHCEKHAA